jgi:hypothetical protein
MTLAAAAAMAAPAVAQTPQPAAPEALTVLTSRAVATLGQTFGSAIA